jgi:hypothetical protein
MRKAAILLIGISLAGLAPLVAQETAAEPPPQTAPMLSVQTGFTYNPDGRRDPFKDLLGGRDLKEKSALGEDELFIDDLVLFGIVKNQNVFTALICPVFPITQGRRQVRRRIRPVHHGDAGCPAEDPRAGDPPHEAERRH